MDDAVLVRFFEALRDLFRDRDRLVDWNRAAGFLSRQRLTMAPETEPITSSSFMARPLPPPSTPSPPASRQSRTDD